MLWSYATSSWARLPLLRQAGVVLQHPVRFRASELDELHVRELRDLEAGQSRLLRAEELARAAQLHVRLGESEAVGRLLHQLQALAGILAGLVAKEQAVALLRPPADAPPELVELREPEAVGALDHHHRGVRDVDPDFDHGSRDEDVGLPGDPDSFDVPILAGDYVNVQPSHAYAGDVYLSLGSWAEAEEMYALALQKGGVDRDRTLTRLGIAQAQQGKKAEAKATFAQVGGARVPVARMWSAFVESRA